MVDNAEVSQATKLTHLHRELAAKEVEVCALREKLRASNFAQQALESRLLELERGELNGEHQDSPETATPPVHVLDLDTLCLPRDVELRLGLGVGSGVVSDPALPPAATGGWTVQQRCTGLPGSGEVHWEAPAVAVATGDTGTATGDVGQPMPAASNTAGAGGLQGPTGGPSPAPALRAVTLESVRRGAEAAGATVTLAVVEDMGEGGPLSLLGRWGRRVLYASPAYVRLVDAGSEEAAVRGMDAAIAANTAIRSSLAGFLKLLLVGGDTAPALLRNVYYHPDRRAEMVFMWVIPVLVVQEADVRRCLDRGHTLEQLGSGPPRLGFVSYTDKASSLAREVESGLREHMCLKYTPTPVTMVDGEGFVVMQNAASITSIGIQGSEGRTAGSCRLNYLQELFVSDPTANDDMRAVTSTGRTWSRRLRVSDSPLLRAWMQLGPTQERWHEVAISRFRDPAYRTPVTACIVAETDVTATVLAERRVLALQWQQQALLREILPQQVIDVLLCHLEAPADDSTSPFCSDQHMAQEGLAAVARCSGSGMGIPMTRQHAALARSRTDPVAALGLHAAGAATGLMDGGSSVRPGCDIPAGRSFPACAASVESSSLCSSVVNSSYTAAGLPAGGAVDGANRFLAAAAASGAAVLEGAGSGRPQHLRGCASVGGETPPHHPATAMLHAAGVGDTMREAAQLENDLAGPAGSIAESAARLGERSLNGGWHQISGSPALGDSDDVGRSGGAAGEATNPDRRMLRGTSSAGYSDCSGRGLSLRDVMALATWHESVTVVFADVVGFTSMCQQLHPARVMAFLDDLYNAFDHLLDHTGCYKVETIGDCYMVCSGLLGRPPSPRLSSSQHGRPPEGAVAIGNQSAEAGGAPEAWYGSGGLPEQAPAPAQLGGFDPDHAAHALEFAKGLVQVASSILTPMGAPVQMRVGLHSGSVVSGVVGRRMPRFCLFGDTVNTASRMESTGAPGRIHVSEATRALLLGERWEPRGTGIDVKGRGRMQTYWLADGISGAGGHSGGGSSSANLPLRSGSEAIPAAPASDVPKGSGSGRVASAAVR